jgi:hypothetical protein
LKGKIGYLQKVWQNGVFFKNTANGGQTSAKMTAVENGGGCKRRPNGGQTSAKMTAVENSGKSAAKISGQTAALYTLIRTGKRNVLP